jgi:hypothetical protein
MVSWLPALLPLLAQWGTGQIPAPLHVIASGSPRPAQCATRDVGPHTAPWQIARAPHGLTFCRELARGYAALHNAPKVGLAHAERAAVLLPNDVAPKLLRARALSRLARFDEAWTAFAGASVDFHANSAEVTLLHDYAITARHAAPVQVAAAAYRRLLTRIDLFADPGRVLRVLVEGAFAVLHEEGTGPAEALAMLRRAEALNDSSRLPQTVAAALQLVREWQGKGARAEPTAVRAATIEAEITVGAEAPKLAPLDRQALLALASEHWDRDEAAQKWQELAEAAKEKGSPWQLEAERRARALNAP